MHSQPFVSIIISAYNAGKHIEQTLLSVLDQTWQSMEIIVINDGSTDNTAVILERYKKKGITVLSQTNKGQDAALNFGYSNCKGDYIKFMDSDDLINPEMISRQINILNYSTDHVAYGEWGRFYNDEPSLADFTKLDYWKDMSPLDFLTARPEGVMLQCGIMLIPRKLIEKAGLWDERLILFNDTEFFNRVILKSKGVLFCEGARLFYRSAQNGSISAQVTRKFFESTFLATNLIAEQLLALEDTYRIRNLISNTYLNQYYRMYPHFPDLIRAHEEKIKLYGFGTVKPNGGRIFKLIKAIVGWKIASRMQALFYKMGYKPVNNFK
ncbi:glycosyltransferase family 2 protein [Ferruginibacter paludis]|nr:glycosyltransferase family 2 protein [Ferruginibacter paludis]MDN3655860.1 glycosyltransferase family 2 protein [Ferruginibacter paludis]